jgi:putative copper resistance protein D
VILLSGFLDVFFRGLIFIGLALGVGGVVFYYFVLRPSQAGEACLRRTASLIALGALIVAVSQISALAVSLSALADEAGRWPFAAFLSTGYARVGILHAIVAISFLLAALRLRRHPESTALWAGTALLGALMLMIGAWLTHGASRLEDSAALMSVTVIHQLAAAAWIGGTIHLTAQWRLLNRLPDGKRHWSALPAHFSPLALGSVVVLVGASMYLSWVYIHGIDGLVGTSYGTMVLTKIALMGAVLLLGGINNLTIRHWKLTGDNHELLRRLPVFAEVEAGIGVIILLAAAALTGQPPAVDVLAQQATPAEVLHVFAPKMPQLTPPPHAEMLETASSSLDLYALPSYISRVQSDFNHNISGIFVILIGLAAFLSQVTRWRWARHWPLLFIPFALFLTIIGEPNGWPLGPEPFWRTLIAPEVFQHRLATLLVITLGITVWRVQVSPVPTSHLRYVLPMLMGIGGALLLTHSHTVFSVKWAFLIEVSHNTIAVCAVFAAAGAWIEQRLPGREGRVAGVLWPVFFTLVGVVLLFYREV